MPSDETELPDLPPTRPDAWVSEVRTIDVYHSSPDKAVVRFIGANTTVDVGITDPAMVPFLVAARDVFDALNAAPASDLANDSGNDTDV